MSDPREGAAPSEGDDGSGGDGDDDGSDYRPATEFPDNPERVAALRETADDLRERGGERAAMLGAVLYRVSDLYDPAEPADTDPENVYRNMRNILQVTERGTLERD